MNDKASSSARKLKIFISHKMPSDTALASEIGSKLALYHGTAVEVRHAGMFRYGDKWREKLQQHLKDVDWLIYLFTDQDEDWGFCLWECGFFQAQIAPNDNKKLITFTRNVHQINDALKEFNAAPMTEDGMFKLLNEIYRDEPWKLSPKLTDEPLRKTASEMFAAFSGAEKVEANFDVTPSIVVELANTNEAEQDLKGGRMPKDATIFGLKDWQKLFNRPIDTGAWLWADLVSEWPFRSVYEYLLSRMMYDALHKRAPKGIMLRSLSSNEVYRLTLRRYEKLRSNKYRFYFTASLLEMPFSISVQKTGDLQTVLYHLVVLSWYFRRRVVDELYRSVLQARSTLRQRKSVELGTLFDDIAFELFDIDAQAIIRGVDNLLVADEALGRFPEFRDMRARLSAFYDLRSEILTKMASGPQGLDDVARGLGEMASINFDFYKIAANAYAAASVDLSRPWPL